MKRRTFIETSIAAAALFAARPSWAAASEHEIKKVGLQLYTVRDVMKTDFEGTIGKVAATGYKEVEFAGYFDHSPKDVRRDDFGTRYKRSSTTPKQRWRKARGSAARLARNKV